MEAKPPVGRIRVSVIFFIVERYCSESQSDWWDSLVSGNAEDMDVW